MKKQGQVFVRQELIQLITLPDVSTSIVLSFNITGTLLSVNNLESNVFVYKLTCEESNDESELPFHMFKLLKSLKPKG